VPANWLALSEEDEDDVYWAWSSAVLNAVAALGASSIYVQTSDNLGVEALRALAGVRPSSPSFVCEPRPDIVDAVVHTNVSQLLQTVGDELYVWVNDAWSGMFLHMADPSLLARFGEPGHEAHETSA
jgi:hypothetical protein